MELMEEDNMAFGTEDLPPDEQQLEVLEDIWLKAGEIGKISLSYVKTLLCSSTFRSGGCLDL